jgi:hypothetical protein
VLADGDPEISDDNDWDGGILVAIAEYLAEADPRDIGTSGDTDAIKHLGERIGQARMAPPANPVGAAVLSEMLPMIMARFRTVADIAREIRAETGDALTVADQVIEEDPDGAVFYLRATILRDKGRLAEAADDFQKAADTPSLVRVRDFARAGEAECCVLLLAMADSQPTRERLLACLELIGNGRSLPDDVVTDLAPARLIQREMAGDHFAVIRIADEILLRDPGNPMANDYRSRAVEELKLFVQEDSRSGE